MNLTRLKLPFLLIQLCFVVLFLSTACRKDVGKTIVPSGNPYSAGDDFEFTPCTLLKEPGTGWKDTTLGSDKYLQRIFINPLNRNEIIYITSGSKLFNYNIITHKRTLLYGQVLPNCDINKNGWIVATATSGLLFKIKHNGDSLTLFNIGSFDVKWDYTGEYLYYFVNNEFYLMDKNGNDLGKLDGWIAAPYKTQNKAILIRFASKQLIIKNWDDGSEKVLFTGTNADYRFLSLDRNDENVYFDGKTGIIKINLATQQVDTLIKYCPNGTPNNPANPNSYIFQPHISPNSNKLTFVNQVWVPVSSNRKYTVSHALQLDLQTKKISEIKLFD